MKNGKKSFRFDVIQYYSNMVICRDMLYSKESSTIVLSLIFFHGLLKA